jgi:hypothetical protein|tara:strand:- start:605 stop:1045 length:441 start_codon:yes stop_codon:yes gene_type:complete
MNISPKLSHILSAAVSIIFVIYFFYQGFLAYVILKELGGGVDALVASRWGLAVAMSIFACLFFLFIKIKDLKSQRTILKGIFIGWSSICLTLIIAIPNSIYFIILTGLASTISLLSSKNLIEKIKEEKKTLTEKEIYLLQRLANKK